jgi:hypothetical protein
MLSELHRKAFVFEELPITPITPPEFELQTFWQAKLPLQAVVFDH